MANPNELSQASSLLLGSIALIPLLIALRRSKNTSHDTIYAIIFCLTLNPLLYFWLSAFENFSFWAILGVSIWYIPYYLLLFIILGSTRHTHPNWRVLIQVIIWTSFEFLKSIGALGFPWGMLSNTASENILLIQIADFMGMWGTSLLLATINACLVQVWHALFPEPATLYQPVKSPISPIPLVQTIFSTNFQPIPKKNLWRFIMTPALLVLLTCTYGYIRLTETIPITETISIHMLQANRDPWNLPSTSVNLQEAQHLTQISIQNHGKPDLVLWSETFLMIPYSNDSDYYYTTPDSRPFMDFLRENNIHLVTGMMGTEESTNSKDYYNSAALFSSEGFESIYHKQHLVPMGEFLPFWHLSFAQWFYRNVLHFRPTWSAGNESIPLRFNKGAHTIALGLLICFEDSFSYLSRRMHRNGANILVNISNNSWAGVQSTLEQQFSAARYRSVETRLSLVRLGENGLTQVVDAYGRVIDQAEPLTKTILKTTAPIYERQETFYTRYGNVIPWTLFFLSMLYTVLFALRFRRVRL